MSGTIKAGTVRRCGSCGAPIVFRYTPAGKRMPLDLSPDAIATTTTYVLDGEGGCKPAEPMFDPPGETYHTCHFDTCPNAFPFRR